MNLFNSIKLPRNRTNRFKLNHDVKMSFTMGRLVPSMVMDVVPGDKVTLSSENFLRFAPLVSPVMHKINVTTDFFFVPNRILWPDWEDFITGKIEVAPPTFDNLQQNTEGFILDYLGIPTGIEDSTFSASAFPLAAYTKIWDEWYRDQNLQNERFTPLLAGNNNQNGQYEDFIGDKPFRRAWMHDYFTSALPFAQAGDPVSLPLLNNDTATVVFDNDGGPYGVIRDASGDPTDGGANGLDLRVGGSLGIFTDEDGSLNKYDPNGTLKVDVNAEAATVNDLRKAFSIQRWLERNARGGSRYIETMLAHFGVRSSDARLQRPELICRNVQNMVISEVLSTAQTIDQNSNDIPVGYMGGHGISFGTGKPKTFRAEEHGWIIGLINVQPITGYQQGIPRMYSRDDKLDYFWPDLAHIGEQEIKYKEIYAQSAQPEAQDSTFGYIPRYAEYKYLASRCAGEMRSTLSHWHLNRIFSNPPSLNSEFIEARPDDRIFAVQGGEDHIYAQIFNKVSAIRPMPKYGIPSIQ
jgi:hypothetical protein